LEFVEGRLEPGRHPEVESHLQICGRCRAELAMVCSYVSVPEGEPLDGTLSAELIEAFRRTLRERSEEDAASSLRRPGIGRRISWLHPLRSSRRLAAGALVAALVLAVWGGYLRWGGPGVPVEDSRLRAGDAAQWKQGLAVERVDDEVLELSWPPCPRAGEYRVLVLDRVGNTLLRSDPVHSPFRLDLSSLRGTKVTTPLFVTVECVRLSGETLRSSPRIVPPRRAR